MLDIVCMFKMVSQDLDTLGVVGRVFLQHIEERKFFYSLASP